MVEAMAEVNATRKAWVNVHRTPRPADYTSGEPERLMGGTWMLYIIRGQF
ncbi:hypothetical protein BOTNAR_0068g00150 [Botryotinia narcissicola]|uniref:Uncharacterized protein n=1 Tax=Botryotinia narcissicola TaxID=278944 RepID=A0A4Z1JAY6_9HELO|nr:hypothetical protein BOTNAR_0068g00150 [Botryotinia narcissicola]